MVSGPQAVHKAIQFVGENWMVVFRSALFLASFMVILEHYHVLEWLDVFMLKAVPTVSPHTAAVDLPAEVLVFTIQDELFEDMNEFKSRSPIDRAVMKKYLQQVTEFFPDFKVLAIDYDLSPNDYDLHHDEQDDECIIDDFQERKSQKALDSFLLGLNEREYKVVLIKHLPVQDPDFCKCKMAWEKGKYKDGKGILFGQADLLHYGLFGPVVKYDQYDHSFPAIVLAAKKFIDKEVASLPEIQFTCDNSQASVQVDSDHDQSTSHPKKSMSVHRINYVQAYAKGAVQICRLYGENGVRRCEELLSKRIGKVEVIFFGGDYGRDDIYITPLGAMPGVTVQAYTYFSMQERLKSVAWWAWGIAIVIGLGAGPLFHRIWRTLRKHRGHGSLAPHVGVVLCTLIIVIDILVLLRWAWGYSELTPLAWGIDIIIGCGFGLLFHWIWHKFHKPVGPHVFTKRVCLASANFLILLIAFALLVVAVAPGLAYGIWINPALIFIGLFIDSYMAAATAPSAVGAHGVQTPLYTLRLNMDSRELTTLSCR